MTRKKKPAKDEIIPIEFPNPDAEPRQVSEEELAAAGIRVGPCLMCGGESHFYITDPYYFVEDDTSDIKPGNYCLPCFTEHYPEAMEEFEKSTRRLQEWLNKRFAQ